MNFKRIGIGYIIKPESACGQVLLGYIAAGAADATNGQAYVLRGKVVNRAKRGFNFGGTTDGEDRVQGALGRSL